MKVYLLTAEHQHVPGTVRRVFANRADAVNEAVKLITIMRDDEYGGYIPAPTVDTWEESIAKLQDIYGAAHVYVDIDELDVEGSKHA